MTIQVRPQQAAYGATRYFPVLLLLFAGSGCAALIYEVVWYQMLQLVIGSTSISVGVLLATFMGGLCLGSIGLARIKRIERHPLRLYAMIEAGIAVFAVLVLYGLPLVERVYFAGAGHGLANMLMRSLLAAICLLPPTMLMGASLPAAARWIEYTPRGASWWGLLYGTNTLGAVFGCLLAGFYLLRIYNIALTTFAAVAFNIAVAGVSLWLAGRTPEHSEAIVAGSEPLRPVREDDSSLWPVYVTIALSGATALGAEVVWTRLIGYLLGATVYVFSIILAVFLIGLGIGSTAGSWIARSMRPRLALGWSQLLLMFGIFWTAYMIAESLPYWPVNPMLSSSPWFNFQIDMARCLWAILPATLLWGASFPLALAAASSRGKDPARMVGGIYAANTLGAIVGALSVSLIVVPSFGTQQAQRLLLLTTAGSALILLVPHVRKYRSMALAVTLGCAVVVSGILASNVKPVPWEVIAFGRKIMQSMGRASLMFVAEGRNSSLVISRWEDGAVQIDVNGHVEATTEPYDMRLQRMVGHLAGLLHPNPKSVLGIGFGAGVSAGTFTRYPTIEHITICEIEPLIPPTSTRFFGRQNYSVYTNPRTRVEFDDARHYLMTTSNKYDIIASDPLDVFVKGTAALYSKEYFEAVKRHLNPGGMFTLYVPLY